MKSIICGMVFAVLVSPALANEYWVEYNYSTHVCAVVEKKSPDTSADAAQGATAADTTNAIAPNVAATADAKQSPNAANTPMDGAASGVAPVIVVPGSNDQTTSNATRGANAANTATDGAAPVIVVPGSNDQTTSKPTQGANANTTAQGTASGAPNAPTAWSVQTDTGTGDNNVDPFKALAESWARKKAAAEAAGTDTTKALIGTAMHSREEAESEMQVMRKCGLEP